MKINSFIFVFIVLLGACSTGGLRTRVALRDNFAKGSLDDALNILNESKYYKSDEMKLLYLMEKGMIYHQKGVYSHSISLLTEAKDLIHKLYTQSLKGKLKGATLNENYDIYYGESYERSLVYFYLALNRYLLAQRGQSLAFKDGPLERPGSELTKTEVRDLYSQARAEIVGWDSFLETLKRERLGKTVFKYDMMAKTFGAFIHESIGTNQDRQIAYQLYKDAREILNKNYNAYLSLNDKANLFKKDYSKLPKLKKSILEKKYIGHTPHAKNFEKFLQRKILELGKRLRPSEYRKYKKQFKLKGKLEKSNVAVVFQNGLIAQKVPEKQYFSLVAGVVNSRSSKAKRALATIGEVALTVFAAKQLGLLPPPGNWRPARARYGLEAGRMITNTSAISFELPRVNNQPVSEKIELIVKNSAGKVVAKRELVLASPLGDIAEEAVSEKAAVMYMKVGSRLAVKHLLAIAAAYGTYKAMKGKNGASMVATLQYMASAKAIEASEKADTRYWSTLPGDMRFVHFNLPSGEYEFIAKVSRGNVDNYKMFSLGKHKVDPKGQKLISFRSTF